MKVDSDLPGAELVEAGLSDVARGDSTTIEALLIAIGAPRLRNLGLHLPSDLPFAQLPEHELYRKLSEIHGDVAHSRYNALLRRLVSFERACETRKRGKLAGS